MEAARKLNFFPAAGGISKFYSPREMLHQQKLDYNKQCLIPMFSYVLADHEEDPSNTLKSRKLESIYLRPVDNIQGGHEFMNLKTGARITRHAMPQVLPMPEAVIKAVESLATKQEQPMGLKVTTKRGTVLYDSALTAGVEYTHQHQQQNYGTDDDQQDLNEFNEDYANASESLDEQHDKDEVDPNQLEEIVHGPVQPEPSLVPLPHQLPQPGQGYYDVQMQLPDVHKANLPQQPELLQCRPNLVRVFLTRKGQ